MTGGKVNGYFKMFPLLQSKQSAHKSDILSPGPQPVSEAWSFLPSTEQGESGQRVGWEQRGPHSPQGEDAEPKDTSQHLVLVASPAQDGLRVARSWLSRSPPACEATSCLPKGGADVPAAILS